MMNYENIYNNLKEYMFYPDVITRNMSEVCQQTAAHAKAEHAKAEYAKAEYAKADHAKGQHIKNNFSNVKNELVKHGHGKETKEEKEQEAPFFIPSEKDKFFWGFYIFVHGEYEYKIAKNNWFSIEKQWKIDTMKKLESIKPQLKDLKIKVSEIEDELINSERLSLKGLQVFCMLYEVNILYVSGRKYCEFLYNNDKDAKIFVIENDGIYRNTDNAYLKNIRDKYWKMENVNKPLKGASAYSLQELQDICVKMEIELVDSVTKKKKTMKVLYQELLAKM